MKEIFFEGLSTETLVAGFIWALIGLSISLLMDGLTRDPMKGSTPVQWSWSVFFSNKIPRFLKQAALDLLVILATMRFMDSIIGKFSMFYCFMVGFGLDFVIDNWKKFRDKFFNKGGNTPPDAKP